MPQLDFTFYISNIFWTLISFSLVYCVASSVFTKKVSFVLSERESKTFDMNSEVLSLKKSIDEIEKSIKQFSRSAKKELDELRQNGQRIYNEKLSSMENNIHNYLLDRQKEYDKRISISSKILLNSADKIISIIKYENDRYSMQTSKNIQNVQKKS